jgi:hypothetical protein
MPRPQPISDALARCIIRSRRHPYCGEFASNGIQFSSRFDLHPCETYFIGQAVVALSI